MIHDAHDTDRPPATDVEPGARVVRRCPPQSLIALPVLMASLLVSAGLTVVALALAGVDLRGSGTTGVLLGLGWLAYAPTLVFAVLRGVEGTLVLTPEGIRYRRAALMPERGWSVPTDDLEHISLVHSGWRVTDPSRDPDSGYFATEVGLRTARGRERTVRTQGRPLDAGTVAACVGAGDGGRIRIDEVWGPLGDPPVD